MAVEDRINAVGEWVSEEIAWPHRDAIAQAVCVDVSASQLADAGMIEDRDS
jgi:hypothetical protein